MEEKKVTTTRAWGPMEEVLNATRFGPGELPKASLDGINWAGILSDATLGKAVVTWADESSLMKTSFWGREYLCDPTAGGALMPAAKVSAKENTRVWRFETVMEIKKRFPHLLGVAIERVGTLDPRSVRLIEEGLVEILHKANFHRDKYGYGNHRRYSSCISGLARDWTPELGAELITCAEAQVRSPEEIAQDTARALAIIAEKENERLTEYELDQRRIAWEAEERRLRAAKKALEASDAPELSPELVKALQEEAERGFGSAAVGVW